MAPRLRINPGYWVREPVAAAQYAKVTYDQMVDKGDTDWQLCERTDYEDER